MRPSRLLPLTIAFLTPLLAIPACNRDGTDSAPTLSPSPIPSPTSALTPPTPPAVEAGAVVDLAAEPAAAMIFGVDTGDLRSDLPPLVSGDFNGDGVDDVLLGARFGDGPDNGREDAGEAYVILGSRGTLGDVDLAAGEQDMIVWGANPGDNLGFSAAAADVNADGVDDILLGAPFARASADATVEVGAVYIILGDANLQESVDLAQSPAAITLVGPGNSSFFGDSLASGDVNGDGIVDVIVGATFARRASGASASPGAAYVLFGSPNWPSTLEIANGEYDAAVFGAEDLDELGDTVASGDINGDGLDDVIMTAEAADGPENSRSTAAEVHVVFGSKELSGDLDISLGDQDVSILGADEQDTLGFSLASGDVNGDGVADLIMGARGDNGLMNAQNGVGAVYILFGGSGLPPSIDLAQSPTGVAALYGVDAGDAMDFAVVGDAQGDGENELLIGTGSGDGPDNGRRDAGEVYVLDRADVSRLKEPVSIGATRLAAVIYGAQEEDRLGTAMAVGDVDGDGRRELLILAADADGPGAARPDAGQVFEIRLSGD